MSRNSTLFAENLLQAMNPSWQRSKAHVAKLRRIMDREMQVFDLQRELSERNISHKGLKKPELAEIVRQTLEKELVDTNICDKQSLINNRPALAMLRQEEIKMIQWEGTRCLKVRDLDARCKSRGLKTTGRKKDVKDRLIQALQREADAFTKAVVMSARSTQQAETSASMATKPPAVTLQNPKPASVSNTTVSRVQRPLSSTAGLTDEQRRRIEENRQRALAKQQAAAAASKKPVYPPITPEQRTGIESNRQLEGAKHGSSNEKPMPRPVSNPYLKSMKMGESAKKEAAAAAASKSPVYPPLTPEQRARIESNRQKAFAIASSSVPAVCSPPLFQINENHQLEGANHGSFNKKTMPRPVSNPYLKSTKKKPPAPGVTSLPGDTTVESDESSNKRQRLE